MNKLSPEVISSRPENRLRNSLYFRHLRTKVEKSVGPARANDMFGQLILPAKSAPEQFKGNRENWTCRIRWRRSAR